MLKLAIQQTDSNQSSRKAASDKAERIPIKESNLLINANDNTKLQRKASCSCGGDCPRCQQQSPSFLPVSHPSDALEIEADNLADKVMSKSDNKSLSLNQTQALSQSNTPVVQTKSEGKGNGVVNNALSNKIVSSKSGGSSIESNTQAFMQNRFGKDFSGVKIHTDGEAVQMSRQLNAEAFTVGNDIYFNAGYYQPDSETGKHLLAHELAHVVQQRNNPDLIGTKIMCRPLRTARINFLCGGSDPFLRSPPSGFMTLSPGETEIKITSNISWDRPAECGRDSEFFITLMRHRSIIWDANEGTKSFPVGTTSTQSWTGLSDGDYYLEIRSSNTNPNCCLTGTLTIEAF